MHTLSRALQNKLQETGNHEARKEKSEDEILLYVSKLLPE